MKSVYILYTINLIQYFNFKIWVKKEREIGEQETEKEREREREREREGGRGGRKGTDGQRGKTIMYMLIKYKDTLQDKYEYY